MIRYLGVDGLDWWHGKRVLLPPDWIGTVNWDHRTVSVDVTRDQIKNAPEWDSDNPVTSTFEDRLYKYYARQRPEHGDELRADQIDESVEKMCIF
jgi:hypothetical protein